MTNDRNTEAIDKLIAQIKEYCGLILTLCGDSQELHTDAIGRQYFNVLLKDRCWCSEEYAQLEKLVHKGVIKQIAPNGVLRVAVFV